MPVSAVDEKALTRAGVRVVVQMIRVACSGQISWGFHEGRSGVGTLSAGSRKEMVGITRRLAHADEQEEVLVVGGVGYSGMHLGH